MPALPGFRPAGLVLTSYRQDVASPALIFDLWRARVALQRFFHAQAGRSQVSRHLVRGEQGYVEACRAPKEFVVMSVVRAEVEGDQKPSARLEDSTQHRQYGYHFLARDVND